MLFITPNRFASLGVIHSQSGTLNSTFFTNDHLLCDITTLSPRLPSPSGLPPQGEEKGKIFLGGNSDVECTIASFLTGGGQEKQITLCTLHRRHQPPPLWEGVEEGWGSAGKVKKTHPTKIFFNISVAHTKHLSIFAPVSFF